MMIRATRLDNTPFVINAHLIATVEATPDTVITLTTDRKVVVRESVREIVRRVTAHLRRVYGPDAPSPTASASPPHESDAESRGDEPGWTSQPSSD
jgi:flagellar protein FlbD